jgi:uncharacterized protein (TIGR04255 family)
MNFEKLIPNANDHAIENVILALEWNLALSIDQLNDVRSVARPKQNEFPREEPQQFVTLNVNQVQNQPAVTASELAGYSYTKYESDGAISKQLQLTRQACILMLRDYTSWSDLIEFASKIFAPILNALPAGIAVTVIGLQYSDRFNWTGKAEDLKLDEIFRESSPFVPSNIRVCKLGVHSHHGYFKDEKQPFNYRRLDNVNVNISEESESKVIQIVSSHRANLKDETIERDVSLVKAMQIALHDEHKNILKQLLTDSVLEKIGFNKP